jgi:hypothetical protein
MDELMNLLMANPLTFVIALLVVLFIIRFLLTGGSLDLARRETGSKVWHFLWAVVLMWLFVYLFGT